MKKICFYTLLAATLMSACSKEPTPDPNGLSPDLQKVNSLIASAGTLQTAETAYAAQRVQADTLPGVISNYIDPYSRSDDGYPARCVETTTEYDITENPMEFVTLDPWSNLWPGALVQGASLAKGVPALISIYEKRKPGRVSLSLVSGNDNMDTWYKEVPMRGSDVIQAQNELMSKFLGGSIPARTSFEIATVSSVEEMSLKLGINFKLFGAKLSQEFGKSWNEQHSYVAVKLNQLFFTMAYDAPDGGFRGVFTDDIRAWELENYTGFGNPICYVGSVSYGRTFLLVYESSASSQELEVAVSSSFRNSLNANTESHQKKILNESRCKMVQVGGNPEEGLATVFGDFDKLRAFIENGAVVSAKNVGAPISYAIYHLKDNTFAQLSSTLKYSVTTKTYYPVEALNNVVVDVLSLRASQPKPQESKYKVSGSSYVKIKSLGIRSIRADGSGAVWTQLCTNAEKKQHGNRHGIETPLSGFKYFLKQQTNERLVLECLVEVHNQIYYGGTKEGTRDVLLTRTFECTDSGQWRATTDGNSASGDTFTTLTKTEIIAGASTDLELKIRFAQDGIVLGKK